MPKSLKIKKFLRNFKKFIDIDRTEINKTLINFS